MYCQKYFYFLLGRRADRSKAVLLFWIIFVACVSCLSFLCCLVCFLQPCGDLLGKYLVCCVTFLYTS